MNQILISIKNLLDSFDNTLPDEQEIIKQQVIEIKEKNHDAIREMMIYNLDDDDAEHRPQLYKIITDLGDNYNPNILPIYLELLSDPIKFRNDHRELLDVQEGGKHKKRSNKSRKHKTRKSKSKSRKHKTRKHK